MESPSYYLGEICQAVEEVSDVEVSEATICQILRKNGKARYIEQGKNIEQGIWQLFFLFLEKCLYL